MVSFGLNRNNSNSSERTASISLLSCVTAAGEVFFWSGAERATAIIELAAKIISKSGKHPALNQSRGLLCTTGLLLRTNPAPGCLFLDTNERQPRLTGICGNPGKRAQRERHKLLRESV